MTVPPSTARETAICELVTGLKADGIWSKLDLLYVMAAHDMQAASLNWIDASFDYSLSAGVLVPDVGVQPNVNIIINTNYAPLLDSTNYALNDASFGGVWDGLANGVLIGARNGSINNLLRGFSLTDIRGFNQGGSNVLTVDTPTGFVLDSLNSGTVTRYKNGSLIDTQSRAPNASFSGISTFFLGTRNTNNVSTDIIETSATIRMAFCSSSLTGTEAADFNTRIGNYFAAL
tara:strand:+ start:83 stop:778 length:696 start_codon:yes stop_codon:yes gene_type:complete